jgi:hypothetical protein
MRSGTVLVVLLLPLLGGCIQAGGGNDNSLLPTQPVSSPLPTRQPPQTDDVPAPVPTTPASPTPTGFSDSNVVPCNGTPTGAQVIAVVRRQPALLPAGATVTVQTGPMCISTWQYTILVTSGREPLQVLTKGVPPAISFVTAGTDVCTVDVRATAPVALLDLASCG